MDSELKVGQIVLYHIQEGDGYNNGQKTAPAIVVNAWSDPGPQHFVNVRVFTDGTDTLWKTSVKIGSEPGNVEALPA